MFYYTETHKKIVSELELPNVDFNWTAKFSLAPFSLFQYLSLVKSLSLCIYLFLFNVVFGYLILSGVSSDYNAFLYALNNHYSSFSSFFAFTYPGFGFLFFKFILLMLLLDLFFLLIFEGLTARIKMYSYIFLFSNKYNEQNYKTQIQSMEQRGQLGISIFLILLGISSFVLVQDLGFLVSFKVFTWLAVKSISAFTVFVVFFLCHKREEKNLDHIVQIISTITQERKLSRTDDEFKEILQRHESTRIKHAYLQAITIALCFYLFVKLSFLEIVSLMFSSFFH